MFQRYFPYPANHQTNRFRVPLIGKNLDNILQRVHAQLFCQQNIERKIIWVQPGKLRQGVGDVPLVGSIPGRPAPYHVFGCAEGFAGYHKLNPIIRTFPQVANYRHGFTPPKITPSPLKMGKYSTKTMSLTFGI